MPGWNRSFSARQRVPRFLETGIVLYRYHFEFLLFTSFLSISSLPFFFFNLDDLDHIVSIKYDLNFS